MRTRLHLICAPWSHPAFPSIQLGCLKAYVDRRFRGKVKTFAYSSHLDLLHRFQQTLALKFFDDFAAFKENVFLAVFYERYLEKRHGVRLADLLDDLNQHQGTHEKLTPKLIKELGKATMAYLDEVIVPNLAADETNVIGFTMNYDQFYSSAFMARYLEESTPNIKKVFLWGGNAATTPHEAYLLRELGASGYRVLGEGEKKLELLLEDPSRLDAGIPGVVPVNLPGDAELRDEKAFASQLPGLESLPTPDYDEFFGVLDRICAVDPILSHWLRKPRHVFTLQCGVVVEGTRGCFAHCDFCSMNATWEGFRKLPAEAILSRVRELAGKYRSTNIRFADNVCDTWAEKFAEDVIASKEKYTIFMELRAHHPEKFWTKLALAGVTSIQVGTEALSGPLLRAMGKGTRVIQNLLAQKYLTELGIDHQSNNLITHHPKSQLKDIEETMRILKATRHWGGYGMNRFGLLWGSPLYESLTLDERRALQPLRRAPVRPELKKFVVEYWYEIPERLRLPKETEDAWDRFVKWYSPDRFKQDPDGSLTVAQELGGARRISDSRSKVKKEILLDGLAARIHDECHRGPGLALLEQLISEAGPEAGSAKIRMILDDLIRQELVLEVEGSFVALATRPREELVMELRELSKTSP